MMKHISSIAVAVFLVLASCGGRQGEETITSGEARGERMQKAGVREIPVLVSESSLKWQGSKPGGDHYGKVMIEEGSLNMENGMLTGGKVLVDMTAITNEDIENDKMRSNLLKHLKSPDFFSVDSFPQARFMITGVTTYTGEPLSEDFKPTHTVTGDLTIKKTTRSISFPAHIRIGEDSIHAKTQMFYIDRSEWDVRWGSKKIFPNLKDRIVHDEVGIAIDLLAGLNE